MVLVGEGHLLVARLYAFVSFNTHDAHTRWGTTLVNPILEEWKLRHSESIPARIIQLKGFRAGIQTLTDALTQQPT